MSIISSSNLNKSDLPRANASWDTVCEFALTLDPNEIADTYAEKANNLSNATSSSSITELRTHIFVEQRRWNHFGEIPDNETIKKIWDVIELLRAKLK